ncbi:MAG: 3-isopropylmalate dehydratase small subunit [Euryarchaeota archaeon]|nr:3-isopropylmalate dehydratase small subunit [Euryarchaeota archaeon]
MRTRFRGRAWTFADSIDTDMIVPGKYLTRLDPESLGEIVLEGARPEFAKEVEPGDIIVAGDNFGCGSSREHAPLGIIGAKVPVVVAENFARIFYRNAINVGLPVIEAPGVTELVSDGDEIIVDIATGTIENIKTGRAVVGTPLPPNMQRIIAAGGLVGIVRQKLGLDPAPSEEEDADVIEL